MAMDKAQTWVYAEQYAPERDAIAQARAAALDLGANPISTGVGATLRMLAALSRARAVLEIGTGAGISGLWVLDGMSPDGVLTTIDHEIEFQRAARHAFANAGIASQRTRLIAGRALDVLPRMAARAYDMVVIDADVAETPEYLDHALRVLRPAGVVAMVHAMWFDKVADPAQRDSETVMMREAVRVLSETRNFVPCLLPVGDGLAVAVRA